MRKFLFFAIATIAAMVTSCDDVDYQEIPIPDTNLVVIKERHCWYDKYTGNEAMNYWTLVTTEGETICPKFGLNWGNTFYNSRGIVLIQWQPFDCRNGIEKIALPEVPVPKVEAILATGEKHLVNNSDSVWRATLIEPDPDPDKVRIFVKQGNLNGIRGDNFYLYDLQRKKLLPEMHRVSAE